ncbi:MAG: DUF2085 domain-containing protein [Lachnospiraceae bacterium]|nr:DUF2085 domain-containing protein [Lachnospiraceae bacterium]
MSGLRQAILEQIRIIGNHSGCHQMPERSFFYKGKQFPVCARCTGVFVGQILAVLGLFRKKRHSPPLYALLLMAWMGADWGIQEAGVKDSTNPRRFVTGIAGGYGLFSLYFWMIRSLFRKKGILQKKNISKN